MVTLAFSASSMRLMTFLLLSGHAGSLRRVTTSPGEFSRRARSGWPVQPTVPSGYCSVSCLVAVCVDDGFGESLRSLLRQVVPDTALDDPVLVLAGEFAGVGAGVRVRRAVGVSLQGDGRHGDGRKDGELPLQVVVSRFPFAQAEPPPVIVDHDRDVIRVIEGGRAARERSVVEIPLRRRQPPDELAEVAPVLVVAGPAAV